MRFSNAFIVALWLKTGSLYYYAWLGEGVPGVILYRIGIRLYGAIGSIYAQTGYLDYALTNPSLVSWVICTGIWHINFPVTQSLTSFDFSRTLVNTHTVRRFTPSIVAAVAFTALLLAIGYEQTLKSLV